jgi:hypothetical protein
MDRNVFSFDDSSGAFSGAAGVEDIAEPRDKGEQFGGRVKGP